MALEPEIVDSILGTIGPDIQQGFGGSFEFVSFGRDLHGSDLAEEHAVATGDFLVAAPWVYRAQHVGLFLGVPATFMEIELRGTTFVRTSEDDPSDQSAWAYYRYIDYLGALHQLGVTTTTRPALMADEWVAQSGNRS
jgi:hypothetical protein